MLSPDFAGAKPVQFLSAARALAIGSMAALLRCTGFIDSLWGCGFLFSQDLDVAIVRATNHVENPPKERHLRSASWIPPIFSLCIFFLNLISGTSRIVECRG
jgi:hypothetical protein